MSYDFIYMLKPIKEVEPGWWKLKWKPIFKHTWSIYTSGYRIKWFDWAFQMRVSGAHNGWNRSYDRFDIHIEVLGYDVCFWIRCFNFYVC